MNPVHAGWAMTTVGAVLFFALGYLIHGLRRAVSRGHDEPDLEEMRRLADAATTAQLRVAALEQALDDARQLFQEREQASEGRAEEDVSRLQQTLEDERRRHVEALQATKEELNERIAELEAALESTSRETPTPRSEPYSVARETIDSLKAELDAERALCAKLRDDLEAESQRAQELLAEHDLIEQELQEERKRSYAAAVKTKMMSGELEKLKRLMGKGTREERPSELELKIKDVAESVEPSGSSEPEDIADVLSWNDQGVRRTGETLLAADGRVRTLEQRIRAFQERQLGKGKERQARDSSHPANEKVLSGVIGDLVLQLASTRGIHSAVLADAQGLPFAGVGLPRFRDGIAAYAGLLGQLTSHAGEFIPLSSISWSCLHDQNELAFSCWLFTVAGESFTLSTVSAGNAPKEQMVRKTIEDLALALS